MPEPIVTLNEGSLRSDLRELVRKTVEDTLNGLLEAEADELVGAERYERTAEREAYRAGHYDRGLTTSSGEVTIHMPKLKGARFTTAIIERCRRRETSVEEAMIEMYLAGVSTRRIEDVSEILWGSSVSAATVSNLNEKAFASVEEWRNRPLERAYPYVYVDGIYLKRSWGGAYENVAVMIAIGVNDDGYREVIGAAEGFTESSECWREFLSWLRSRGLHGVRMVVGDKASGMVGSIAEVSPEAAYQRCTVHFYRNVLARVPKSRRAAVAAKLKAVHAMESREGSEAKALAVAEELEGMRLRDGEGRPRRLRRDLNLHRVPSGTLGPHPHQQRHRAAEPRGPQANARGGHLPGREVGAHARHREAQVRRGERVGLEALPGREAVGGVAVPEAGLWAVGKCARILTVPSHLDPSGRRDARPFTTNMKSLL